MEKIIISYLKGLKIPISEKYFEKLIQAHPDYPSILSVADVLHRFGISHQIARIEREILTSLPFPYILYLDNRGGELIVISNQADLNKADEALKHWKGIVLKAEPTDVIADSENQKQLEKERLSKGAVIVLLTSIILLSLASFVSVSFSWVYLILSVTALVGTATGYLLLAKDLDIKYKAVETFCNAGKSVNCDKILNSDDAKLFGQITFSDAAITYFLFQLVVMGALIPLTGEVASWLSILGLMGAFSVPVIFYSLYYQQLVAKTWCRLCLVVVCVLFVQVMVFAGIYSEGLIPVFTFDPVPALVSGLLFLTLGSAVILLKNTIEKAVKSVQTEISANRFRHSPALFVSALQQQRRVDVTPFDHEMRVGNSDSPIYIVMAVNLFCGPCRQKLKEVSELLSVYPEQVTLWFRILKSGDEGRSSRYLIEYWFQKIFQGERESNRTLELVNDWYDAMSLDEFIKDYPLEATGKTDSRGDELEKHFEEWMNDAGIIKTPTVFLNGREMPDGYSIEDLTAMVPGLVDQFESLQEIETKQSPVV